MSKRVQREEIEALFEKTYGHKPTIITRAPGRIEFIGNHTDYNQGTVIGASIDRSVWVALRPTEDGTLTFYSDLTKERVTTQVSKPERLEGSHSWVNYPLGCWVSLPAFGLRQPAGFEYLALSDVPTGAGLSSSAAIELATILAYLEATKQVVDQKTLVKIGRHAENNFVGVPCGFLDQTVSAYGKEDHLVYIDCRGPTASAHQLPKGVEFWIFNTHTKHALIDKQYESRFEECKQAAEKLGVDALADIPHDEIHKLEQLDEHGDVKLRAKHVIEEIHRVERVMGALEKSDLKLVGELLTASHRSSQHQFHNSTEQLDFLVDQLASLPHVYGARLTGGGFGGAVLAVASSEFTEKQAQSVAESYEKKYGGKVEVLKTKTGPGAEVVVSKSVESKKPTETKEPTESKKPSKQLLTVLGLSVVAASLGFLLYRRFRKH